MTDLDLVVRGRCVVGGAVGPAALQPTTVGARDGRIAVVETGRVALTAARTVDLDDDEVLLPGLVDTHVHVNEPGRTDWEGFATATRAAACGGITTIVDMPLNSIPTTTDVPALAAKRAVAAGQLWVDVGFWGGAVPANLGRLAELQRAGVFGFKCFLLHSGVDDFAPLTPPQLDAAMAETAALGALLIVHAENAAVVADAPGFRGRSYADFLRSRPDAAEVRAVDEVLELAAKHRARVHILHLSSAEAVERLATARAAGVQVSVETCPHYLTLSAEDVPDGQTQFKCCPPIRGRANREALWGALADGVVDLVVSDHSPCTPAMKQLDSGDFAAAWGGISSLQLGLPLLWTEARRRGHPLTDVVRWLGTRPAHLVGVPGKGSIDVGQDADLIRFAPDQSFVVDPARLQHRHPLTPYAGRELTGVVRSVWLRGRQVVAGAEPAGTVPAGRFLTPASVGA